MSRHRVAALLSAAAVAAAVVTGLWFIGSPSEQRTLRADEQRVMDLRQLSNAVTFHWNQSHELASRVENAVDGRLMSRLPVDPESKQPYEYRVTGTQSFETCATFSRRSPEDPSDFWFHDAGRRCYSFDLPKLAN